MENSKIEWTDHTFSPWIGCSKVSAGCHHCYAEALMDHRQKRVKWGPDGTRSRTSNKNWKEPLIWNANAKAEGVRRRVFCSSLADVFEDRPELEVWRHNLIELIAATPDLDWLLLTKRPENISRMLNPDPTEAVPAPCLGAGDYLPNIWLGTSVENQEMFDLRAPKLIEAAGGQSCIYLTFLSMEPLLGPVDMTEHVDLIDWVIVGGESGKGCRPMDIGWARSIKDQCWVQSDLGTTGKGPAFFFKQTGGHPDKGAKLENIPVDLRVRMFPR